MVEKKYVARSGSATLRAKRRRQIELSSALDQEASLPSSDWGSPSEPPALSPLYIPPTFAVAFGPPPPTQSVPYTPLHGQSRDEEYPLPDTIAYLNGRPIRSDFLQYHLSRLQEEVRRRMPQYSPATWEEVQESMVESSKAHPSLRDYRSEMCAVLVLGLPPNARIRARFDKADDVVEVELDWDQYFLRPAVDVPLNAFESHDNTNSIVVSGPKDVTVLQTYWLRTEPDPEDKVFLLYELTSGRGTKMGWMDRPLHVWAEH